MSHKFDIAISFAGEDREVAKKIAIALKKRGLSVFYDEFYRAEMWGKPLWLNILKKCSLLKHYTVSVRG